MADKERLSPPLSKDHPIYQRGYIVGGTYLFGGQHRSPDECLDQCPAAPDSPPKRSNSKEVKD